MNLLLLCRDNAVRSILLESIFNKLAGERITAYSAALETPKPVHPLCMSLLGKFGGKPVHPESKPVEMFTGVQAPGFDAVIILSGAPNEKITPVFPGMPPKAHWKVEDPAKMEHPKLAAFEVVYAMLEARAKAWLALDFERMDAATRQHHLNKIGEFSLVM